jgi:hypothetical protein
MSNSSKKNTGRPALPVKRENAIGIRLTGAERFIIVEKARRTGMNFTTYIRQMAITGKIIDRLTEEDRQILRQLIQMSGSISELAKMASDEGMPKAMFHYEGLRNRIDNLIDQFNHDK